MTGREKEYMGMAMQSTESTDIETAIQLCETEKKIKKNHLGNSSFTPEEASDGPSLRIAYAAGDGIYRRMGGRRGYEVGKRNIVSENHERERILGMEIEEQDNMLRNERLLEESGFQVIAGMHERKPFRGRKISHGVTKSKTAYQKVKRVMDVVCSLLALIVLSPIFLVTAIAIMMEDGGPVIYAQDRNGLNGKVFRMYKFRSMCRDAEKLHKNLLKRNEADGPVFKMKRDPRVTKVGRVLRRTSIDELPQLINILKGDMSIVGPRPIVTYETERFSDYQKQRMVVKPGLTCYWQCSGRNELSFEEWIEMDLRYIKEANLFVDIKIILKTVRTVVSGKGAY